MLGARAGELIWSPFQSTALRTGSETATSRFQPSNEASSGACSAPGSAGSGCGLSLTSLVVKDELTVRHVRRREELQVRLRSHREPVARSSSEHDGHDQEPVVVGQ